MAVSKASDRPGGRGEPPLRLQALPGPPLGAVFGAIGLLAAGVVALLRLDRVPATLCVFKGLTGVPCPSCGSTRALARLAALDLAAAFALNPLATAVTVLVGLWAAADIALLPRGLALSARVSPGLALALRGAVLALALANWAWLVAAGR